MPTISPKFSLIALLAIAIVAAACSDNGSSEDDPATAASQDLPEELTEIMSSDAYSGASWGLSVEAVDSGEVIHSISPETIVPTGSTAKLLTVATFMDVLGPDTTWETPVHALGDVVDGRLDGPLVLVGSGDLTLGGREAETGTLGYGIPPQPDSDGRPGVPAPGNPTAGLDDLAQQVAAAGISEVDGDVVVDDRLFEEWPVHRYVISPIVVNDNVLAVTVAPGEPDEPAEVGTAPVTTAFTVINEVETVMAGGDTQLALIPGEANELTVIGSIAEGAPPHLLVHDIEDPARWARTLFIEALGRAGVTVSSDPAAENDVSSLPDSYSGESEVGSFESPKVEATSELILKISHNYGADLSLCLLAAQQGSTDCNAGYAPIRERLENLGFDGSDVWMLDGHGGSFSSATPEAMMAWLTWISEEPFGDDFLTMLPTLGVDGSLILTGAGSPSEGKVWAKTGTWAGVDEGTGRLLMPGKALAGYLESESGALYRFTIFMANGSWGGIGEGLSAAGDDLARMAMSLQQTLP